MSSSFEKSVKGATKIKAAPPKTKYIEHILVATHSGEAGIAEVFRSLQNRLRDSTWTVVLKGLITVHLMIREGSPDVTLAYLAKHRNMLAISSFTDVQTQGKNIRRYSTYLGERARAFASTKTDWVRAPETRLERTTVEKGLLRETEAVQRQLHTLLKCDVLEGEPDNEITLFVFRLLVLDLLPLFQLLNQGLINILGQFFEMSKPDAERAMEIYRIFTRQTDQVVSYLATARENEHHTGVKVPKLKHAPVNLGRQLEDYLKDPDFEVNRRQYLAEQDNKKRFKNLPAKSKDDFKLDFPEPSSFTAPATKSNGLSKPTETAKPEAPPKPKGPDPDLIDFFDSIEQNQTPMDLNSQPSAAAQQPSQDVFQAQSMGFQPQQGPQLQHSNTFPTDNSFQQPNIAYMQQPQQQPQQQQAAQQLQPNFTGAGFGGYTPQPSFQPGGLSSIPQESPASFQQQGFAQLQQQQMQPGALQPMQTGQQITNPFRQSMLANQQTGMQNNMAFSPSAGGITPLSRQPTNPFARSTTTSASPFPPQQQQQQQVAAAPLQPTPTGTNPFTRNAISAPQSPSHDWPQQQQPQLQGIPEQQQQQQNVPLAPQPTGSTNPFRQGAFVNHNTGMGWQHNQMPMGGGLDQMGTTQVFPRPVQQTPWQQQQQQQ